MQLCKISMTPHRELETRRNPPAPTGHPRWTRQPVVSAVHFDELVDGGVGFQPVTHGDREIVPPTGAYAKLTHTFFRRFEVSDLGKRSAKNGTISPRHLWMVVSRMGRCILPNIDRE